jgi:hypothetical protein
MKPLLERHGLDTTPDEGQRRLGVERGMSRVAAGFAVAIRQMNESLPPYVTLYAQLEAAGPTGDQGELAYLTSHEIALVEFAKRALAGEGVKSLEPVRTFLDR